MGTPEGIDHYRAEALREVEEHKDSTLVDPSHQHEDCFQSLCDPSYNTVSVAVAGNGSHMGLMHLYSCLQKQIPAPGLKSIRGSG